MGNWIRAENSTDQYDSIYHNISNQLKNLRQQYPERLPKPTHVLATVHDNVVGEWKVRLKQAKALRKKECVVLIPYKLSSLHWIGILIKYEANGQIERAESIDSRSDSIIDHDKLQHAFAEVYQGITLRPRSVTKYDDPEKSTESTIANLLKLAEEVQYSQVESANMNALQDRSVGNNNPGDFSSKKERSISILTASESSNDEFFNAEDKLQTEGENESWEDLEYQITTENLKNMQKDISSMPSCVEKSVMSLLYYVSLKLPSTTKDLDQNIVIPDRIETEIEKEYLCLKERLKLEDFLSSEIENLVEEVWINIKNENWKCSLILFRKLFEKISPLNISELFRLIEKIDIATQKIKNQDIIFFFGGTGSGKSTTIHFLAGSKMKLMKVQGLNHIAPIGIGNPDLKYITTSPFARSETRYITPVTVNMDDVGGYNNGTIILCDSPGFGDTNGPEVDIANGIAIVRAIRECRSVKPVVLVSYRSIGDRFEGLKNLAHILAGLIPGIQDQIAAFSYIFTKYPENERDTIHASLNNIRKTMNDQEKSDISFTNLFRDMLHKTENGAQCIDPINDKPGKILDELTRSCAIQHPEEVFQFFVTEKSQATVNEQITKHQLSIRSAVKRSEYLLIKHKLDQLKNLNDLLGRKDIEHIYTDCVQYINQHLSNEYQQGVSFLDRCLFHQTVLTKEGVEQYKTYIDHASLAEKLRDEHLGKELIHSSAFIQYLNRQVRNMCETLKRNDIDDLSIKTSLDKIKLLSEFFHDIHDTYRDACGLLAEKVDNIVKSFESFVLNNQFDDSATNLTKLSGAHILLHDHLDHQDIEIKYTNAKEYFLSYLSESVKKFYKIFTQKRLEAIDIDSLNNCVHMLEIAIQTYNLQQHISKEDVNRIYEDLSSKILNYFHEIVKNINTEFENKNTLDKLETLMNQLDLIREIVSIAHRTNETYYSTLEKLIGHVHESRREAEELLRVLFRREGKVNYDKITKCLSNLNNARWIEKYRRGLHSDIINDVAQEIIEYINESKKSVMNVILDLDNVDKIKEVYQVIIEIHQMKHFENLIPTVDQHIDEVNTWFQKTTKQEFDNIIETFCLDKSKDERYKTFNINKVEKALTYLDICRKIPVLTKNDCISVLNRLEDFVRDFSDFIQKNMENSFDRIKQNEQDILTKVRFLSNRLREIAEIETKYSRVFSCFSKKTLAKNWKNELSNYLQELSDEMATLNAKQQIQAFQIKLSVAQSLSKLDWYLQDEKYYEIYCKYRDIFLLQNTNTAQQVKDAIKNFDYETVAIKMTVLQSSGEVGKHLYADSKRSLNYDLNQLFERAKKQAVKLENNIDIESIELIVENLERMERAKQSLEKHLDAPNQIDHSIREVKKLIGERIKTFLESVKALITSHHLCEADKAIESIILIRNSLGIFCTEEISDCIEKVIEYHKNEIMTNIVEKYSNMDIGEYNLNPPTDIFQKFEKADDKNPVYILALSSIKERILVRFRAELEQAKAKQPPHSENIHIRRFELAVKYLPETMRNALEVELKYCKEHIAQCLQDDENELKNIFDSGDVKKMRDKLVEYKQSQHRQSFIIKSQEIIMKQIQEIILKVNENIKRNNIIKALNNIKKLYHYKIELEEFISEINGLYSKEQRRIVKIFEDAYQCFINRFLNPNISMNDRESTQQIEISFSCLIDFIKFRDDIQEQKESIDIIPEVINSKSIILTRKIEDYSNEYQKKYEDALKTLDIVSLVTMLKSMDKWSSLFTKIKTDYNIGNKKDTLMNSIVTSLQKLKSPSQMLESISQKIEELRSELINQDLLNTDTKEVCKYRNEFYQKLNEKFSCLRQAKILSKFDITIDINKIEQECLMSLQKRIKRIWSNVETFLNGFSQNHQFANTDYDYFNLSYYNLISIKQEMKIMSNEVEIIIQKIESTILKKIYMWENSIKKESSVINIAESLQSMKLISHNIPLFKMRINQKIDELLNSYKSKYGTLAFAKLGTILNQDINGIGKSIISEHNIFHGYALSLFNEKTRRHGIDYVLEKIRGNSVDTNLLKKRYDEFRSIYDSIVKQHLRPNMELDTLISDTKLIAGGIKQNARTIIWNANIRDKVLKLAAHVFALWTLQNARYYFEVEGLDDKNSYLLQPHAAQVISIFRMLGIGDKKEELVNNLVEIGTGEGKSIVLGVTACILSLLGFDVRCACYSEYLSQRDYSALLPLFDSLGIQSYIHYGTFNKLCEDIINENGDIRRTVEQLISDGTKNSMEKKEKIHRAKILLIDEVDVFFSREFCGNVYTPSVSLRDPSITSLVDLIWTQRTSKLTFTKIKVTAEYKACCDRYSTWKSLIDEAMKDMIADVNNFESHDYIVKNDKIGYREQDNITYNVIYGYKTLFAYYCEHEKGNITKESLHEHVSIKIDCGSFSYAEIPVQFRYIIGVTGTLETLSDLEKKFLENDYKIVKTSYIPSVFGINNLKFVPKDDIMIENSDDYFNRIKTEIDVRLVGNNSEKRAVFIFFESKQKLIEFYNSDTLASIKDSVACLTEEASLEEKEYLIKRTTSSGQITLFTRTFGRGTDFICHDQTVATNGGTHVIQTFLSEESSEEKQIKGRTARQGDRGSYSMILLDQDLEKFQIEKSHIDDFKQGKGHLTRYRKVVTDALKLTKIHETIYDLLHDKRTDLFQTQYEENRKYAEQAKEKHQVAQKFLSSLRSGDINFIRKFLIETNKGVEGFSHSRTVCLMDATSSMFNLLHKCKNTVQIMYERASSILKDHDFDSDSFQIQFAVYRNYNSREDMILQSSSWETKPDNLRTFMNRIEVEGGWYNEAIEIGLWHANQENERERITQIILIGDAPPNTRNEINEKRNRLGKNYWSETRFAKVTGYTAEVAKLISNNIPVHAFYVDIRAKQKFQEIASRTGGQCQMLDINSSAGSDMLTDLVTEAILKNVGGSSKGNLLVEAYRKKFRKSYSKGPEPILMDENSFTV